MKKFFKFALGICFFWYGSPASSFDYENYTVQALAPLDGKVVIKHHTRGLQVLKTGDMLPDSNVKILQILNNHIVVKNIQKQPPDPSIASQSETVWIYKVTTPGGQSKVVRLSSKNPETRLIQSPSNTTLETKK